MNFNRYIDDRDRLMNKWRQAASSEMSALVNEVAHQLHNYENYFCLRKRERRANDMSIFRACVEALVCDLVHRALTSENMKGRIAVSMRTSIKSSRYKAPCDSKQFPIVVDLMSKPEMGYLDVCELGGWQIGKRTAVRAGERLLSRIDSWGIEVQDLRLSYDEEIVIQKTGRHDPRNVIDSRAEWIDYPDSNLSRKYRQQVRTINEMLEKANLRYHGGQLVDLSDKRLRRYFNNGSFNEGGRLFGGFWQHLKRRQVSLITIGPEDVAEVDFETMQVAIARAHARTPHNPNAILDAYHVEGWTSHRRGIKKVLASMLFAQKPLTRWPRETQCLFPPGTNILDVRNALERAFPEMEPCWYSGWGYKFMFTESQILVDVLLKLAEARVIALPKHDCVIVPKSKAALASRIMRESFESLTGGLVGTTINGRKLRAVA